MVCRKKVNAAFGDPNEKLYGIILGKMEFVRYVNRFR